MGDTDRHLIHGSLEPPKSSTQTASRSVEPLFSGLVLGQTNRQSDHARYSAGNNRPHLRNVVLRCRLIMFGMTLKTVFSVFNSRIRERIDKALPHTSATEMDWNHLFVICFTALFKKTKVNGFQYLSTSIVIRTKNRFSWTNTSSVQIKWLIIISLCKMYRNTKTDFRMKAF